MSFSFSAETQTITVCHYDATTGEYLSTTEETIPPHTGLPANCTTLGAPDAVSGYAWTFINGAWVKREDHRGETVYVKATRAALQVTTLGSLLDTVTTLAPTSDYDVWNATSGAWEEDTAAKLAAETEAAEVEKGTLLATATQQIEIWSDAVDQDDATDTDSLMLAAWKKYRVQLNKVDTSDPENITWPDVPTEASVTAAAAASATTSDESSTDATDAQA